MVKEILFATGNQGKAKELKEAFKQAGVNVEIKTNADLDNPPHPIESGHTFEANAKIKAHELAEFSKLPTIADDSGLMVDALDGEPGVRSARYAGEAHNDAKNNAKLLANLGGVPDEKERPSFGLRLWFQCQVNLIKTWLCQVLAVVVFWPHHVVKMVLGMIHCFIFQKKKKLLHR